MASSIIIYLCIQLELIANPAISRIDREGSYEQAYTCPMGTARLSS
jgi:hypothetical protein